MTHYHNITEGTRLIESANTPMEKTHEVTEVREDGSVKTEVVDHPHGIQDETEPPRQTIWPGDELEKALQFGTIERLEEPASN